jgi:glycolate oxidase iron-sulfur subunit
VTVDLHLQPDDLAKCVQCSLCLPHCPTFRVTGDETMSPRGRIALMRAVQTSGAPLTEEVADAFTTCVQCRGCETACPSGVPYGRLIDGTREAMADQAPTTSAWQGLLLAPLAHPRILRGFSTLLALGQRAGLVPRRLGLPRLPLRRPALRASGADVALFTGCVMDAWSRETHLAAQRVLEAMGFGVEPTGDAAPCCGALHAHLGQRDTARRLARQVIASLPGDAPVLVDSAGCGAALKEYGGLLGTEEAARFARRVYDIQEWVAAHLDRLPAVPPLDLRVAIQDPCHLRHVQRAHHSTRSVLRPLVRELVEIDDDGLCCGAGGAYAVLNPRLATAIRSRKLGFIESARADVVASANPGCSMHLAAAGVATRHPMELVDAALRRTPV